MSSIKFLSLEIEFIRCRENGFGISQPITSWKRKAAVDWEIITLDRLYHRLYHTEDSIGNNICY